MLISSYVVRMAAHCMYTIKSSILTKKPHIFNTQNPDIYISIDSKLAMTEDGKSTRGKNMMEESLMKNCLLRRGILHHAPPEDSIVEYHI